MKRILALILCFVMVFSLVAVAEDATTTTTVATTEFSDVPATSPYKEAISTLTGLGIILGDAGANTFRPEAGITRAEFCVIVARLKNMGALNVIAETPFTDVTTALCDEWKVKAVRIASDLGIVAGMGDGTFAPDSPVTYEQAVKMLVCLLKYEPLAKQSGGWPAGYIAAGAQIGLTAKAYSAQSEPAPRQIIAQLVYNALDIPEMGNTTGGVAGGGSTILDNSLKVQEAKGVVTATSDASLTEGNSILKDNQIQIDYKKIYNIGSTDANKHLGKEIEFYYTEDDDVYTIQNYKRTDSNNESEFPSDRIKHLDQDEILIYTDENQDDYDSYSVDSNVKLIYNNAPAAYTESSVGYLDATYKPYSGSLKMIDNNGNNVIDVIIITDAKPFVVSQIDSTEKTLWNLYDPTDTLNLKEGSGRKISIKKGSSTVSFSSISKNNVLLVSKSLNTTGTKYINVEIVSNTKTGVIKAMSTEDRTITIGADTYEVSDLCWNKYASKFQMDSSVTIYLDNQKKILYVIENTAAASSYTYGYLINAGKEGNSGISAGQVSARIFTQAGMITSYPFAEKVKYYGYNPEATDGSIYTGDQKTPDEVLALLNTTGRTDINKDTSAVKSNHAQLVKYSLNSKGEINTIFTSVPKKDGLEITSNLLVGAVGKGTYKSSAKKLGDSLVNDSTKIFFVPTDRSGTDDYAVGNRKSLASDSMSYEYETYDIDDGFAKVAVVFGDTSIPAYYRTTPTVVVSQIIDISTDDGPAHRFSVNCSTAASDTYTTTDASVLAGIKEGDVIKLKLDKKGLVEGVIRLFSPASISSNDEDFLFKYNSGVLRLAATSNADIRTAIKTTNYENYHFCTMYGTVNEKFTETMIISLADVVVEKDSEGKVVNSSLDTTEEATVTFTTSTRVYLYSKSKGEVTKDTSEGAKIKSFKDYRHDASNIYLNMTDGKPSFAIVITE